MAPREFDAMTERLRTMREDARYNAAMVVAAIYNVNRDPDKRPEGFTPEDILGKSNRQTLEEFALECARNGYKPLPPTEEDRAAADKFLEGFQKTFKHHAGQVQLVKE